jgi:hypothetical protein
MKTLIFLGATAAAFILCESSFAQQSTGLSRAEVKAEQAALERAGYYPRDWINYPDNVQAAERKLAEERQTGGVTSPCRTCSSGSSN